MQARASKCKQRQAKVSKCKQSKEMQANAIFQEGGLLTRGGALDADKNASKCKQMQASKCKQM
jgi:hypothetical protein